MSLKVFHKDTVLDQERSQCAYVFFIGGHRHRSQCRQYLTSDINICYSDIGDKYVGLKNVIPIIGSVVISTSELILISDIEENKIFHPTDSNSRPLEW
jgi:hypothetical protein